METVLNLADNDNCISIFDRWHEVFLRETGWIKVPPKIFNNIESILPGRNHWEKFLDRMRQKIGLEPSRKKTLGLYIYEELPKEET